MGKGISWWVGQLVSVLQVHHPLGFRSGHSWLWETHLLVLTLQLRFAILQSSSDVVRMFWGAFEGSGKSHRAINNTVRMVAQDNLVFKTVFSLIYDPAQLLHWLPCLEMPFIDSSNCRSNPVCRISQLLSLLVSLLLGGFLGHNDWWLTL